MNDDVLKSFVGENSWLFLVGLVALLFRSAIEKLAASLFVFFGKDYAPDDIILLDGKPGRIVRVGLTQTTFYLYEVKEGKIVGGTKLCIQNERLASLNIEKPLQKIDLP
ncbi:MAG: hypothetical protein EBR82_85785 [Caulobacteraceae bacterium]|nr:hypothetical protein [Caulobacteraceae bacterium]